MKEVYSDNCQALMVALTNLCIRPPLPVYQALDCDPKDAQPAYPLVSHKTDSGLMLSKRFPSTSTLQAKRGLTKRFKPF